MKWVSRIPLNQESLLIRFLMKDHLDRLQKNRPAYHIMSRSNRMSLSADSWISEKAFYVFIMETCSAVSLSMVLCLKGYSKSNTHWKYFLHHALEIYHLFCKTAENNSKASLHSLDEILFYCEIFLFKMHQYVYEDSQNQYEDIWHTIVLTIITC